MAPPVTLDDLRYMDLALALAFQQLGSTAPNPSVGCVIVKTGQILACAATAATGRPHAEPQALLEAGSNAAGSSLYVTLEPCSHQGQTPPCVDAIIKAAPKDVIIGCMDPNPKVYGQGAAKLRAAGIDVLVGVRREACERLNAGFFSLIQTGKPIVVKDPRQGLWDGKLVQEPDQSLEEALLKAGSKGLTRVFMSDH